MLKVLPNISFGSGFNTKCGEIFCQTSTNFTIICNFCEMKAFEFEDFLLHFRNVHFENNLLKSDEVNLEGDRSKDKTAEKFLGSTGKASENEDKAHPDINLVDHELTSNEWSGCADDEDGADWTNEGLTNGDNNEDEYKPKKSQTKSSKESKTVECELCKKLYKSEGMLKHHVRRYHKEGASRGHSCSLCSKTFAVVRLLNEHMMSTHDGFSCSQCDRKYQTKYDLEKHKIKHSGIRNFICDFENCGKGFFTRGQLTRHRRVHTDSKQYICEACGYACRMKGVLQVHYRTHTGEKPFACNTCGKRFASSSLLKEHQPIHSTERPHVCSVCGAAFSRAKALYHHKHLHLAEKKYKCKICGNAYAQAAGLAGHMRQHKAE